MGEFEKRMEQTKQTFPVEINYTDKTQVEMAVGYNTLKINRMIEEAKKEIFEAFSGLENEYIHLVNMLRATTNLSFTIGNLKGVLNRWFGGETE